MSSHIKLERHSFLLFGPGDILKSKLINAINNFSNCILFDSELTILVWTSFQNQMKKLKIRNAGEAGEARNLKMVPFGFRILRLLYSRDPKSHEALCSSSKQYLKYK